MNNDIIKKLIWFCSPITKLVYIYLAYIMHIQTNNTFKSLHFVFLCIGIVLTLFSIVLYRKVQNGTISKGVIGRLFLNAVSDDVLKKSFVIYFMILGYAEAAALFGLVQYVITGNLIVGIILFALCFVAWIFNFPQSEGTDEDEAR